jgi:hypothetical protein
MTDTTTPSRHPHDTGPDVGAETGSAHAHLGDGGGVSAQVRAWLAGAAERRLSPARRDDPAEIAGRIEQLRASVRDAATDRQADRDEADAETAQTDRAPAVDDIDHSTDCHAGDVDGWP